MFLGALPFGLLNLYWNYEACWCNVMFNAINRHEGEDSGWSLATPALYAASLAYLAAPLLWFAWRGRARLREAWQRPAERALLLAWLVPLAAFAALSPVKRIGLHWLLSFRAGARAERCARAGSRAQLRWSVRWFAALAVLHVVAIPIVAALPPIPGKPRASTPRLVFPGRIAELAARDRAGPGRERAWRPTAMPRRRCSSTTAREPVAVFGRGTVACAPGRHRHRLARAGRQGPA